jgi:predicted ester cyclase
MAALDDPRGKPLWITHTPGVPANLAGFGCSSRPYAVPSDVHHIDAVTEGNMLTHFLTGHGTMKGEFMGMPPTGKHASWEEMHMGRWENGKLVELWGVVDQMGMLAELGYKVDVTVA